MQSRVSAAAGRRLRQQLEASPVLRDVLHHPAVEVTRRATARTARLVAPRTADRLIADLKGTEPLLAEIRAERCMTGLTVSGTGTATLSPRRAGLRVAATLSAAAVIGGLLATVPTAAMAAPAAAQSAAQLPGTRTPLGSLTDPQVYPRPQQLHLAGKPVAVPAEVQLILGTDLDPATLAALRQVLLSAGATSIVTPEQPAPAPGALVVYVSSPKAGDQIEPATAKALQDLGADGPAGLPDGGYTLATGQLPVAGGSYGAVALAGVDATGAFYGVQTLRQLLAPVPNGQGQGLGPHGAGGYGFPGLAVRDWPSGALVRGTAESFYGTPWSIDQRLAMLDFLGRTKQNFFLYAPGDDPYRQDQWRTPYPDQQLADLRALADRAAANHVTLGYAVAPSQNFCYSSSADVDALIAKLDGLRQLGFGAFQLQFDNVSYDEWHCGADRHAFGTGPAAAAKAQAKVVAAVQTRLIAAHPELAALSIVPTEFHQQGATPYRTALAGALPQSVQVAWSGVGVIPGSITAAQTTDTGKVFGHPLVTMDNYPVNDSAPDRLYLGPYTGRDPEVASRSAMLLTAGMRQATASQLPLATAADYAWNPTGYQPQASWQYALRELAAEAAPTGATDAGPALAALTALAGNSTSSPLSGTESAYLTPLLDAFWAALQPTGGSVDLNKLQQAADPLQAAFATMAGAPDAMRGTDSGAGAGIGGSTLVTETGPWLSRLSDYGRAGEAALDMLLAQHKGDGATAWQSRVTLRQLRDRLAAAGPVTIGAGVLDPFLDRALKAADSWSGVSAGPLTPTSTMGSANGHGVSLMTDAAAGSFYWSSAPPQPGDSVGVDLGDGRPVGSVTVAMGGSDGSAAPGTDEAAAADDYLRDGVLEYSTGDGGWQQLAVAHQQKTVTAKLPAGVVVRAIRLRATKAQQSAVAVRDFSVTAPGAPAATVTGGPAPAPGSSAASVLDGDPDTAYRAAAAPTAADAPLTVELGTVRPLDRLTVLTDPTVHATATVAVRHADGSWADIGTLRPGYNELPAGGQPTGAVRLTWQPGGDAPVVNQIVPWYADTPVARLSLADPVLDVIAGAPAAGTQAVVDALRPDGANGEVRAAAPGGVQGLTVTSGANQGGTAVSAPRGGRGSAPVQVSAAAGTPSGTYKVPVDFTSGQVTLHQTLQVHVVPPTSGPDLAPTATASSSGNETPKFPASAVNDGDPTTRWSSPPVDNAWVQLQLPQATHLGEAVLHWQDAYAAVYQLQASSDGVNWTTVATVANGKGGTETVRFDAPNAVYLRMQGVSRATKYGYSLYGIELYAVTDPNGTPTTPPAPPVGVPAPTPTPGGVPSTAPSPSASPSAAPTAAPTGGPAPSPGPTAGPTPGH